MASSLPVASSGFYFFVLRQGNQGTFFGDESADREATNTKIYDFIKKHNEGEVNSFSYLSFFRLKMAFSVF